MVQETAGEEMTRMFKNVIAKAKELREQGIVEGGVEWNLQLNKQVSVKGRDSLNVWPNPEWIKLMERLLPFQYFCTGEFWTAALLKRPMLEFYGAVSESQ